MGNWYVSKPDNDGERELLDRAVKALEAELATKTCNKKITSKLEDAELARDSEETCNNKQVISKLVASEDAISIQVVIEWLKAKDIIKLSSQEETARKELEALPSVTPKQRTGHCKDCKYFKYNDVTRVDGIPLIMAHEICSRWSGGCKTKEDGYCFLFEPQESEEQT